MANSDFLRRNKNQHSIKNSISKKMDSSIDVLVKKLINYLNKKYPQLTFEQVKTLHLVDIISTLSSQFPGLVGHFATVIEGSFIRPDGGFIYAKNKEGERKLILVAEVKRQGTNEKRAKEGLPPQARGNAIERLGKNLIGIRAIFKKENIIPFVCFGSGDDFKADVTIRDRVVTMNDFFPLNKIFVKKEYLPFEPVSMFFRHADWSPAQMLAILKIIAEESIKYYFK